MTKQNIYKEFAKSANAMIKAYEEIKDKTEYDEFIRMEKLNEVIKTVKRIELEFFYAYIAEE